MKAKFLILILMTALAGAAWADKATHRKTAEDLLSILNLNDSMNRMINQMVMLQVQRQPQLQPYRHILLDFFGKYLSYNSLKPDFIDIYTEEFTEKELRDIIAFYKTPTGQKTITKMPVLMQKGAPVGMGKVKLHAAELESMIKAEVEKQKQQAPQQQGKP